MFRLQRYFGGFATAVLVLLLAALTLNLWKYDFLTAKWLTANKDPLDAISKVATICTLVLGSVLSYYRFFRGRTLSLRADLTISSNTIEAPCQAHLHCVTVKVRNVGTTTIWHPVIELETCALLADGSTSPGKVSEWIEPEVRSGKLERHLTLIDPGETAEYFCHVVVPRSAWAVTLTAVATSDSKDQWFSSTTIANRVASESGKSPPAGSEA